MQKKTTKNKGFRTVLRSKMSPNGYGMQNPKSLSELLARGGQRLGALKARSVQRSLILDQVRAALPGRLAQAVVSAGVDEGRLTIGVVGAHWASRLRYSVEVIRKRISTSTGCEIRGVRIRVVLPHDTRSG